MGRMSDVHQKKKVKEEKRNEIYKAKISNENLLNMWENVNNL